MTGFVVTLLGGLTGVGALVAVAGARGRSLRTRPGGPGLLPAVDALGKRMALAVSLGGALALTTRWAVAALVGAMVGWHLPTSLMARGRHSRELAKVDAIAGWVEQIRDTLAAANGLEHALVTSARVAPTPIAADVERLAARTAYEPLPVALRRFADEVDHPLADFVVVALAVAAEQEARELGALLGQLAETARDEARLRTRVWVGRARNRTVVRVIGGVLVIVVGLLVVTDRDYLAPYDSPGGQIALAVIAAVFALSLASMERMGRIRLPDRFIGQRLTQERAS